MRVRSERGGEIGAPKGAAIYGDLDDAKVSRALWLVDDDEEDAMRIHGGDVQGVLDTGTAGMLVRYVVFAAAGDVDTLAAAYADGLGRLGDGINQANALLVDDTNQTVVSLTVWRDKAVHDAFLQHADFAAAQAKLTPHASGPAKAENLRVL